ncbi:hypothetical protein [Psychromicrobium xiongbiense]|uniref:hypothetical protein n=1 Tax=Psychromicrobium xiongbiense TaxID=3051184 RepID=UPI002552CC35|nr:hypothetical protein [Psychromicrobium sp. YIM S02556]
MTKKISELRSRDSGSSRATGPGRLLIAVYAVFTLAAGARAGYQLASNFSAAPLAYLLSAVAAVIYLLATVSLALRGTRWYWVSVVAVSVELLGVLIVGSLSLADAQAFPRDTVWSGYGRGYGFVPLLLPILGLIWLYRHHPRLSAASLGPEPSNPEPSPTEEKERP